MVLQLVGEDKKYGLGRPPSCQKRENIKKEVWLTLGKVGGHTIVVPANLLQHYTPVGMVEEAPDLEKRKVAAVPGEPQTKLPEWSLMPNKVNYRRPA